MRKIERIRRAASRGAALAAVLAFAACHREAPDVGRLSTIVVPPAERVEIFSLGNGDTFGSLLWDALDANGFVRAPRSRSAT